MVGAAASLCRIQAGSPHGRKLLNDLALDLTGFGANAHPHSRLVRPHADLSQRTYCRAME